MIETNLSAEARANFDIAANEIFTRGMVSGRMVGADGAVCALAALALALGFSEQDLYSAYGLLEGTDKTPDCEEVAVLWSLLDGRDSSSVYTWSDTFPEEVFDVFIALSNDDISKAQEIVGDFWSRYDAIVGEVDDDL